MVRELHLWVLHEQLLTDVDDSLLTSTLMISPAGSIGNESDIICEGSLGIKNSTVVHPKGEVATIQ